MESALKVSLLGMKGVHHWGVLGSFHMLIKHGSTDVKPQIDISEVFQVITDCLC